jgi:tRNA U54 and U55 pseudouridine synthase Pus10
MKRCYVCRREDADTRPLGEHGQDVCLSCLAQPEVRHVAAVHLASTINVASIVSSSGMVTIDGEEVRPMTPNDL